MHLSKTKRREVSVNLVEVTPKILVSPKHAVNHISQLVHESRGCTLRLRYHQGRYLQTLEMWFSNRSCALAQFIIVPSRRVCGHRSNTRSLWETQCRLSKPSSGFGICNEDVPTKNRRQNARCLAFVKANAVCVRLRTIQREFFIRRSFHF